MSSDFTPEQKRYLEGLLPASRRGEARRLSALATRPRRFQVPTHRISSRKMRLADQEKWKREEHPFDAYRKLCGQAGATFYVAPAQESYMCRLRVPNGILSHWEFAGVADLAEKFGGGYAHVTTRANLQFREVAAKDAIHVVEGIQDFGLTSRGSGADNIRNVTGDATASIGPPELIDTRPHAREWHFHF